MHAPMSFAPSKRTVLQLAAMAGLLALGPLAASNNMSATPGGSDTTKALSQSQQGIKALGEADAEIAGLEKDQLQVRRIIDRLSDLTFQVKSNNLATAGLQKMKPDKALAELAKVTAAAKGEGAGAPWYPEGDAPVPSLAMAQKGISDLQQQIQQLQTQRGDLEKQRTDAAAQGEKLVQQAENATGEEAFNTFKQGADLRKKAADFSAQIDNIDAKVMLLQQDLQVHQAQQKQLTEALARLDDAVKQTNGGWETIQKQIQAYGQLSQAVAGGAATAAPATMPSADDLPTTLSEGLTRLNALAASEDAHRQKAIAALNKAVSSFNQTATLSRTISQQYSGYLTAHRDAGAAPAWQLMATIFNVSEPTLEKGQAELRLAQLYSSQAYTLALEQAMAKTLSEEAQTASLTLEGLPPVQKLESSRNEAVTSARQQFDAADTDLDKAGTGGGQGDLVRNTQAAAKISHAIELYAQSLLLSRIGDEKAKDKLEQARDLIKQQQNIDIVLPSDIAPPKEAAPTGGPTTAPSSAGTTGAGGASPTTAPSTAPATEPAAQ